MCVPSIQARRTVSGQYMSECGKQEAWGKRCWGKQEFEKGPYWPWALTAPRVLLGLPRGLSPALPHGVVSFLLPLFPSFPLLVCLFAPQSLSVPCSVSLSLL